MQLQLSAVHAGEFKSDAKKQPAFWGRFTCSPAPVRGISYAARPPVFAASAAAVGGAAVVR